MKEASVGTVTPQRMVTVIPHSQLITSQIDTVNLANYSLIKICFKPLNLIIITVLRWIYVNFEWEYFLPFKTVVPLETSEKKRIWTAIIRTKPVNFAGRLVILKLWKALDYVCVVKSFQIFWFVAVFLHTLILPRLPGSHASHVDSKPNVLYNYGQISCRNALLIQ